MSDESRTARRRTARRRDWLSWTLFALAVAGVAVVVWACVTEWGGIVHGHPAYAVLLGLTLLASIATGIVALRGRRPGGAWRIAGGVVILILGAVWLGLMAWLRPYTAVEPALAAMESSNQVAVTETPTEIVMAPKKDAESIGVFFQPGALVDPRAYAAVLQPLAASGRTVVIAKQPLGIAFLAVGAFDEARDQFPKVTRWVVGGHSLGGTVAAMEADAADHDKKSPAVGLLFYASYPANDISKSLRARVLSISGSRDGLATPEKIEASRENLPFNAAFEQIKGANHAQFGSYGPQAGDRTPTITARDARQHITTSTMGFVTSFGR